MNELISVIVPVYNVEEYLPKCIESIISQTYKNLEIILVDDGSTDNSGRICDEYAQKDDRIIVLHKENGGLSDARNHGIDAATGKYIGFVDSDDYVKDDMYENLLSQIAEHNAEIAICGRYRVIEGKSQELFTCKSPVVMDNKEAVRRILLYDCMDASFCDKLFVTSLFDEIRFPIGKVCEDIAIIGDVICKAEKIIHIGSPKYFYVKREDSISKEKFSLKRLDMLWSAQHIRGIAIEKYADLNEEANCFYLKSLIYLLTNIEETGKKYVNEKKQLREMLCSDILKIISNRYLKKEYKVKGVLFFLKLYTPVCKTYRFLKKALVKG